jgi:predicted ATPase/DNA-binding SARP family transcriptional activator
MQPLWTIQLLGGLAARGANREVTRFRTHKAGALLAYLAFYKDRPPQAREVLADLFWPDTDLEIARHNLSAELSPLRRLLEPSGVPPGAVVQADRLAVRLDPAAIATDVQLFEQAARSAQQEGLPASQRLSLLLQAVETYQGPLLPGYYDEWIGPEATRLSSRFLGVLLTVVPLLLETGNADSALDYANRAVALDPLSEQAMKALVQTLTALSQPAQALRMYRTYTDRLKQELDQEPSAELQNLVSRLGSSVPRGTPLELPAEDRSALAPPIIEPSAPQEGVLKPKAASTPQGCLRGEGFGALTSTAFFDREAETSRLLEMLSVARNRLVTLTGPPGTGKTRLALEVVCQLIRNANTENGAPASAVFIPLANIRDAARLYEVILDALEAPPSSNGNPLEQLVERFAQDPNMLLLLDNFEQLVEPGAQQVVQLLDYTASRTPGIRLLITSRNKLRIVGEREFQLSPLPLPDESQYEAQSLETLLANASIALFVDRAQAVRPDFQLTEQNARVTAQLCAYLEGIPLAIELAAARVSILSVADILEQVQHNRLDFLSSQQRDAVARHRTLRATLDWSYQLLPEAGRRFLAALSVFHGGWTLRAAMAVGAQTEDETLDQLTLLRDCSLIGVMDTRAGMRFTMLETIREYAVEQLDRSQDSEAVHRLHAAYFVSVVETITPALVTPAGRDALCVFDQEQANILAAKEWIEAHPQDPLNSSLGLALIRPWSRIRWSEVTRWLSGLRETGMIPEPLAHLRLILAGLTEDLGDAEEIVARQRQVADLLKQRGDIHLAAWILNAMGFAAIPYCLPDARQYLEEALPLMRQIGSAMGIVSVLSLLALVTCFQGECERAEELNTEAFTLLGDRGESTIRGGLLRARGILALGRGEISQARTYFEQNLALRRQINDLPGEGVAQYYLGVVALAEEDISGAQRCLEKALAILVEARWETSYFAAAARCYLGRARFGMGRIAEALVLVHDALQYHQRRKSRLGSLPCLYLLAEIAAAQGQTVQAAQFLGASETISAALGYVLFPLEKTQLTRLRASLISSLGEARFNDAWQHGQSLSDDQLLTLATGMPLPGQNAPETA